MRKKAIRKIEEQINEKEKYFQEYKMNKTRKEKNKDNLYGDFIYKCEGYCKATSYKEEFFLNHFYSNDPIPGEDHHKLIPVILKDGTTLHLYSKLEAKVAKEIDKYKDVKYIKTGNYPIKYKHKGETHFYYPDLFVYTKTNKIIIVEVKPLYDLEDIVVKKKWLKLQQHCKRHGLLCMICDENFKSYPDIWNLEVPMDFEVDVIDKINQKGNYNDKDLIAFKKGKGQKRNYYQNALVHIVKRYKLTFKYKTNKYRSFIIKGKPQGPEPLDKNGSWLSIVLPNGLSGYIAFKDHRRNFDITYSMPERRKYLDSINRHESFYEYLNGIHN